MSYRVATLLFGAMLAAAVLLTAAAWRLSRGPVDLTFLAPRLVAALNAGGGPTNIEIGRIALEWAGFHRGLNHPLDLRLHDLTVIDDTGRERLEVPTAAITLSLPALLLGRIVPRSLELAGVRLTAIRAADGTLAIDVGSLAEADEGEAQANPRIGAYIAELMRPASTDGLVREGSLSQLQFVRMANLSIRVIDRQLGRPWSVPNAEFVLTRRHGGGIDVDATATLEINGQRTILTLDAASTADLSVIAVRFAVAPVVPASLGLPALAAIAAPVTAEGSLELDRDLTPNRGSVTLTAGPGALVMGKGAISIRAASVIASGTPEAMSINAARLTLMGPNGRPDTTVTATGSARFGPQRLALMLSVGLDRVAFADLPLLWPLGIGGGARPWVTENMTAGIAHDGNLDLTLEANSDFSGLTLSQAVGQIDVDDVTTRWLAGVPPAEKGRGQIRIVDSDTLDIVITSGQQRVAGRNTIAVTSGSMHIVGMSVKDQDTDIAVHATGQLADIIALLKEPRLALLSTHPLDLRDPAGDATVELKVKLPLESWITLDDVDIGVSAQLRRGHLAGIAAGRDLDNAELTIAANKTQLTLRGTGRLGGIDTTIDGSMSFLASKPRDVTQRIAVTGRPTGAQLAAAGLDTETMLVGPVPLTAVWSKQSNGDGDIALDADLTGAGVTLDVLDWQKPAGVACKASARLRLSKDRLAGVESFSADGADIVVRGSADLPGGRIASLRLDRLRLGRSDVSGSVSFPANGPIGIALHGPSLDAAAKLAEKTPPRDKTRPEPPPGPAWTLSGQFGRVLLANEVVAQNVRADADNDGRVFRRLHIDGTTTPALPFNIDIGQERGARTAVVTASDAGAFLRGIDAIHTMQGGTLSLTGTYDDSDAAHTLTGTAEIADFRVRNAPALGKLLQAMTLYGLVEVVSGPGLGFARLTAPFTLSDDTLILRDARAFSPSLGMTVKGLLDIHTETAKLEGTIVPAYFFNSLLGKIPFAGRLFRSEEGGGLFAARYTIDGPFADPRVFVNPLSILTPGFLRGIFGIF